MVDGVVLDSCIVHEQFDPAKFGQSGFDDRLTSAPGTQVCDENVGRGTQFGYFALQLIQPDPGVSHEQEMNSLTSQGSGEMSAEPAIGTGEDGVFTA